MIAINNTIITLTSDDDEVIIHGKYGREVHYISYTRMEAEADECLVIRTKYSEEGNIGICQLCDIANY